MARSTYIYGIHNPDKTLIALFTVKWEAFAFWERHLNSDTSLLLLRHKDNPRVDVALHEFPAPVLMDWGVE